MASYTTPQATSVPSVQTSNTNTRDPTIFNGSCYIRASFNLTSAELTHSHRHVRVHHVDKNKDDPILRQVLAQRPLGSARGRKRRMNNTWNILASRFISSFIHPIFCLHLCISNFLSRPCSFYPTRSDRRVPSSTTSPTLCLPHSTLCPPGVPDFQISASVRPC